MTKHTPPQEPVSTVTDRGDEGYDKALKGRHLQMIAIGGSTGGIIITSVLGLFGVLLNAFLAEDAFEIVMNLAGIGIAGTWAAILVTHLAYLRKVRAGLEARPAYQMPWAPYSNYAALAFFIIVVGSNITSPSGRWTLGLFAVVIAMMVGGWYAVRNSIRSDLLDNIVEVE